MTGITKLAVYCGASDGADPIFAEAARELALVMAERGIDLVYGGGKLGLMGVMADTILEAGGKVYGVIPEALVAHEVAHLGLTELHRVETMHERKAKFTELSDGFLCLPGGIGTLDELFEAWTWNALGYHAKPFCLLNVNRFWSPFGEFMDHVRDAGFLSHARRGQLMIAETADEAIKMLDGAARNANQGMVW
jgi:uncharacterized protein (TIGR00730 family)